MGKRINIGIYIGPQDTDIAAWFNLLQENHMSRAKWVMALLCAYALRQKLPIGTIDIRAPLVKVFDPVKNNELLFGEGSSQAEVTKRDRYGYGWQIRGPHREFIRGSVINVSVSKAEVLPVLEESWKNGHLLATFLKALIRNNLEYGDYASPPRIEDMQKAISAYFVSQNSKKISNATKFPTPRKESQGRTGKGMSSTPTTDWEEDETSPLTPAGIEANKSPMHPQHLLARQPDLPADPTSHKADEGAITSPSKTFQFDVGPDSIPTHIQPASTENMAKNPLLGQI